MVMICLPPTHSQAVADAVKLHRALAALLLELRNVLADLSNERYSRKPVGPVKASVGGHVRHSLDHLESALIFGPFMFMLIGVFDFGQFLYLHQALTERARSSARYGAMQQQAFTSDLQQRVQNMMIYNQPTASGNPYFGLTPSMVNVTATTPDPQTGYYQIIVKITNYPYQMLSPYIAGTHYGPNISASSASEWVN